MEDFGDDEDDPFSQMVEDLLEDIKDNEAVKNTKKDEKKTHEDSLPGGKNLRDKAAVQILSGGAVAIGGQEPSLLTARMIHLVWNKRWFLLF
jgi:hypothetical protein